MVPLAGSFVLIAVLTLLIGEENGANARSVKRSAQTYTTKYDNIDIDQILASNRLLKNYVNCLLDKGACTQDGKELKKYLPDAIATECSKCSQAQKKIAGRVLQALLLNHRDDWELLTNKYDPDGNFQKKYLQEDEDYSDLEEA
uniref:Chemosensory protein 1 n=1 Tax=Dendroctonus ponderosae TaxID=77166 RepID=A0A0H3W576_DENPD|nr:chemosensory protein 1 [Dendroctonus ponderosae]